MSSLRILISGASVAGPSLAFWLNRAGAQVTIVERAPSLRTAGQTIDIRGAGVDVIRRMELEEKIRARTTKEQGLAFVDASNRTWGSFPVNESGSGQSFTSEFEILRGDLAKIFYDATKEKTEYVFGTSIETVKDQDEAGNVLVTFSDKSTREFDLVIAADGLNSRTRDILFGEDTKSSIHSLGQYTAYFTMPRGPTDTAWSRWFNAPGRRCIFLRPDGPGSPSTRAFVSVMSKEKRVTESPKLNVEAQKDLIHDLFKDAGWEAPRVLEAMAKTDDFYMQHIAQVKLPSWSKGRTAVLGDAAFCPSPISGMGTTSAIVGAYVLAGEIAKNPHDHRAAFEGYEKVLRPFIDSVQSLPPGAPAIANPQTAFGIITFLSVVKIVSWGMTVKNWLGSGGGRLEKATWLPDYEMRISSS